MINGFVRFALQVAQMPDKTVNDLDKSLPGFSNIAAACKELEPILTKAQPHIEASMPHVQALMPLANQAMPIVKKVWPDIVAVTPTIEELIAFINSKA